MRSFYHGTASTFEKSILKHGLRKNRGKRWNAIATTLEGKPIAALEFPGAVWVSENLYLADLYARLKARLLRAKKGEKVIWRNATFIDGELHTSLVKMIKVGPIHDPLALPILFAVEIADDEPRIPACPLTCRLLRAIPPEALNVIRLC